MEDVLNVYIRDRGRHRVAELDDYQALQVVKRFNDVGTWTIDIRADILPASLVTPGAGIIIFRNGKLLMAGPATAIERSHTAKDDRLSVSGTDDNVWLKRRQIWPCSPVYDGDGHPFFSAQAYDNQSGVTEAVLKHYVEQNFTGNGWLAARQINGLVIAEDKGLGESIATGARFPIANTFFQAAAVAGGDVGYAITQLVDTDTSTLIQFDVYQPVDRSDSAHFATSLGNLRTFKYAIETPTTNSVIVGADGEGVDREFFLDDDEDSQAIWDRIESDLIDKRGTTDRAEMFTAAQEALVSGKSKTSLAFEAVDSDTLRLGRDWDLGDIVDVVVDGTVNFHKIVREVQYSWAVGQPTSIVPTIGDPQATNPEIPKFFAVQKATANRVSQLERIA